MSKLVLIIGIGLLLLGVLGYFGNFVQWSNAEQTTAKILSSKNQWARGGGSNANLEIQYSADGQPRTEKVSIGRSTLEEVVDDEIQVYYMRKKPERVIPVAVLHGKQKTIYLVLGLGVVLTLVGVILGLRKKPTSAA